MTQPKVLDLLFRGRQEAIASFLLRGDDGAALIEVGPSTTMHNLLRALEEHGVVPEEVTQLLLTHIHLDHAGATGSLLKHLPNARVYVHERGAPHLVDPSKLIRSASRIYGDQMQTLWGEVDPVSTDRLVVVRDGDRVQAGGAELDVLYTPGHASHHVAYWDAAEGVLYAGDVAGVRLPGTDRALPPTPPPDLDIQLWSESIDRLLQLQARTLYLTHYGPFTDAAEHLTGLRHRLYEWESLVLEWLRAGLSVEDTAQRLEEHANRDLAESVDDPEIWARFRLVSGYTMNVMGFVRYFQQRGLL